jgi:hypothetical protein
MSEPASAPLQRATLGKLLGGFLLCTVVAVYLKSRLHGHWPASHPWSGISLTMFGILNLVPRPGRIAMPLGVLALCSSVLWAWSSLHR